MHRCQGRGGQARNELIWRISTLEVSFVLLVLFYWEKQSDSQRLEGNVLSLG